MSNDCPICLGRGYINLPVRRPLSVMPQNDFSPHRDASRTYQCPECRGKQAADENVLVLGFSERYDRPQKEDLRGLKDAMKLTIAHSLAHALLERGLIDFREDPSDAFGRFYLHGSVGIVSTKHVETLEERASKRASELLSNVADKAAESIYVWGSAHTGGDGLISKNMAVGFMREAFKKHLDGMPAKGRNALKEGR